MLYPLLADTVVVKEGYGDYAVGWFTLALINAGLAQSKRRSGLNWFLISLFIGPIATFLIVVLDRPSNGAFPHGQT